MTSRRIGGLIRDWAAAPIDQRRLVRALHTRVERGETRDSYRVRSASKAETYNVQLASADTPACDCPDHTFRDGLCLHALAVLLATRDPRACRALTIAVLELWADGRLIIGSTNPPPKPPG